MKPLLQAILFSAFLVNTAKLGAQCLPTNNFVCNGNPSFVSRGSTPATNQWKSVTVTQTGFHWFAIYDSALGLGNTNELIYELKTCGTGKIQLHCQQYGGYNPSNVIRQNADNNTCGGGAYNEHMFFTGQNCVVHILGDSCYGTTDTFTLYYRVFCKPAMNKNNYGTGEWLANVYNFSSTSHMAQYVGRYATESRNFSRSFANGQPDSVSGYCPMCPIGTLDTTYFTVQYRMRWWQGMGLYKIVSNSPNRMMLRSHGHSREIFNYTSGSIPTSKFVISYIDSIATSAGNWEYEVLKDATPFAGDMYMCKMNAFIGFGNGKWNALVHDRINWPPVDYKIIDHGRNNYYQGSFVTSGEKFGYSWTGTQPTMAGERCGQTMNNDSFRVQMLMKVNVPQGNYRFRVRCSSWVDLYFTNSNNSSYSGILTNSGIGSYDQTSSWYALNGMQYLGLHFRHYTGNQYISFNYARQPKIVGSVSVVVSSGKADTVCAGSSVTLTADTIDGTQTQWWIKVAAGTVSGVVTPAGAILVGTGSSITVTPDSSTTYYVRNRNLSVAADDTVNKLDLYSAAWTTRRITRVSLPQTPTAPASKTICSDSAYTFVWDSLYAGSGGDSVEYKVAGGSWQGALKADSGRWQVQRTVALGVTDTIWIRSRNSTTGCVSGSVWMTGRANANPLSPTAPASKTICSDSAYTFMWDSVYAGAGGDSVEFKVAGGSWQGAVKAGSGRWQIQRTVALGVTDTIWIRSLISATGCVSSSVWMMGKANAKPLPPTAQASQLVCSDTAYTFVWDSVGGGIGTHYLEWSVSNLFLYAQTIPVNGIIQIPVGSGVDRELFIRGVDSVTGCRSEYTSMHGVVNRLPSLLIPKAQKDTVCSGSTATILIAGSQSDKIYTVYRDTLPLVSVSGNGTLLSISTGAVDSSTTFLIHVEDTLTGCERMLPSVTVYVADTIGAPDFIAGDTVLYAKETIQYTADSTPGGILRYYIHSGVAQIDSVNGWVTNASSNFIVKASTSTTSGCIVKDAYMAVNYSAQPKAPEAPTPLSAWSDSAVLFTFTVTDTGRGSDLVQWAFDSLFTGAQILNSQHTVAMSVNVGETKYLWLRSKNNRLNNFSNPVKTYGTVSAKTDENSVPEPEYTDLYDESSFSRSINLSLPVGTTPGYEGTTPSGAATYTIPIACPPGTNGMAPELALVYNSQAGNGPMGWGWGLSGLSSISRSGFDHFHDLKAGPITLTNDDLFYIDGARLSTTAGGNGANGTKYAKEIEDYSVIESFGNLNGGPEWFKVTEKSGLVMEYGRNADARISTPSGAVLQWNLSKVQDLNGNFMLYKYDNADGHCNISEIAYTGNGAYGLAPYNAILFNYTDRMDPNTVYTSGTGVKVDKLLYSIAVKGNLISGQSTVKQYALEYGNDDLYSYLKALTEWGSDASHLNSTLFKYGETPDLSSYEMSETEFDDGYKDYIENNYSYQLTMGVNGLDVYSKRSKVSGDFNGDGYTDILELYQGLSYHLSTYGTAQVGGYNRDAFLNLGFGIYLNNSTTGNFTKVSELWKPNNDLIFSQCSGSYNVISSRMDHEDYNYVVGDFLGTGRDGILEIQKYCGGQINRFQFGTIKYYTFDNNGNRHEETFPTNVLSTLHERPIEGSGFYTVGDFDADGALDYILHSYNDSYISFPRKGVFNASIDVPYLSQNIISGYTLNSTTVMDFDGDGKPDVFYPDTLSKVYTYTGNGGGPQFNMYTIVTYPNKLDCDAYQFGDFNGDGKTDVITHVKNTSKWNIQYSTGKEFTAPILFTEAIFSSVAGIYTMNWEGVVTTFATEAEWIYAKNSTHELIISDYNGDGKSDVFFKWNNSEGCNYQYYIYYSKGDGFVRKEITVTTEFTEDFYVSDPNADGKADLNFYNNEISFPCNTGVDINTDYTLRFNPQVKERLLHKVSNGFNQISEFEYKPLTDAAVHSKGNGQTYPVTSVQMPMQVLSQMKKPDGVGGIHTTGFFYTNAQMHRGGRGFLGFSSIRSYVTGFDETTVVQSTYASPYLSPVLVSSSKSIGGTAIGAQYDVFTQPSVAANRYKVQKTGSYSFNQLAGTYEAISYSYDQYGNVENTNSDVNGIETTTIDVQYGQHGTTVPALPERITSNKTRTGSPAYSDVVTYTYDAKARVTRQITMPGQACSVTTDYSYNGFGNVISQTTNTATPTGGLRNQTTTYDNYGRFPIVHHNVLNQTSTMLVHPYWGKPIVVTAADGQVSSQQYDGYGRVILSTNPRGIATATAYEWDLNSNGTLSVFKISTTTPGSPATRVWNDALGREVRRQVMGFNGNWLTGTTTYSNRGKMLSSTQPHYQNEPASVFTNTYDYLNRPISSTDPFNNTTTLSYSYSGGKLTVNSTEASMRESIRTTDATGKVVSAQDAGGTLSYKYDSYGNQIEVKSGSVVLMSHTYDACNHVVTTTEANSGTFTYSYDGYGQLTYQQEGSGKTYQMKYDAAGRMTERSGPEGTSYYNYVSSGNGLNQLLSVSAFSGTWTQYGYNAYGELTSQTETINGSNYSTAYIYDSYGRQVTTTYPSGVAIANAYDGSGYRSTITNNSTGHILYAAYEKNSYGQATHYATGNGKTSYLTAEHGLPKRYNTFGVQDLNMNYDYSTGDLTSRTEKDGLIVLNTELFEYDNNDRLISAKVNSMTPKTYTYANNGNILQKPDAGGYVYDEDKINAVVAVSNPDNQISHEEQNISYIGFNKASVISENGYELTYTYSADYNRQYGVLKQNGTVINTRVYSGNYEVNDPQNGNLQKLHYIAGDNGLVAIVVQDNYGLHEYYTYTDHLGSIVKVTDESGTVVAEQNFDAWGRKRNPANWTYTGIPVVPSWLYRGYTGHEMLPQFDLINMNGRMYDPLLGRMLSPDNVVQQPENTQNYNRYSYVLNNPLKYTDPTGWQVSGGRFPFMAPVNGREFQDGHYMGSVDPFEMIGYNMQSLSWSFTPGEAGNVAVIGGKGEQTNDGGTIYRVYHYSNKGDVIGYTDIIYIGFVDGRHKFSSQLWVPDPTYSRTSGCYTEAGGMMDDMLSAEEIEKVVNGEQEKGDWLDKFQIGLDVAGIADPSGVLDGINALIYAGRGQWGNAGISAMAILPLADVVKAGRLAGKATGLTYELIHRGSKGADGGLSRHVIERLDGDVISRTHQVFKEGKIIHQHQNHIGKYGTVRAFPEEWLLFPTIK